MSIFRSLFITCCIALAGCGDGQSGKTQERINGVAVPPMPDVSANSTSVAGVDIDSNGVRDDVDRLLATAFASDGRMTPAALTHAKTLQAAILAPGSDRPAAHARALSCLPPSQWPQLRNITLQTIDTDARREAYGKAFAGIELSTEGC
jgi:hypothetical protein